MFAVGMRVRLWLLLACGGLVCSVSASDDWDGGSVEAMDEAPMTATPAVAATMAGRIRAAAIRLPRCH